MKYPILNSAAEREVEKALRHYLLEAGEALGSRFFLHQHSDIPSHLQLNDQNQKGRNFCSGLL